MIGFACKNVSVEYQTLFSSFDGILSTRNWKGYSQLTASKKHLSRIPCAICHSSYGDPCFGG